MIKGIGIDIITIKRFNTVKDKERFLKQFLNDEEILEANKTDNKNRYWATFFTMKEAIFKAFKTGLHFGSHWCDIRINRDFKVYLSGYLGKISKNKTKVLVSNICSKQYALSLALAQD
ncbi:MAG: 4'-phosphopantetheinyl transferase superfamily protein [bacterium]